MRHVATACREGRPAVMGDGVTALDLVGRVQPRS